MKAVLIIVAMYALGPLSSGVEIREVRHEFEFPTMEICKENLRQKSFTGIGNSLHVVGMYCEERKSHD